MANTSADLTTYGATALLNAMRNDTKLPQTWYLGRFTAAPSDAGGGTEVSGGAYVRKPVTFGAAANAAMANSADVAFSAAPVPPRKPSIAMISAPLRAMPLAMAAMLWTAATLTMTGF